MNNSHSFLIRKISNCLTTKVNREFHSWCLKSVVIMMVSANFWQLIQKQVLLEMRWISLEDRLSLENTKSQCLRSKVSSDWLLNNLKILCVWCYAGLRQFILLCLSLELQQLLTLSLWQSTLVSCLSALSQVSVTGGKKDNSYNFEKKSITKKYVSTVVLMEL